MVFESILELDELLLVTVRLLQMTYMEMSLPRKKKYVPSLRSTSYPCMINFVKSHCFRCEGDDMVVEEFCTPLTERVSGRRDAVQLNDCRAPHNPNSSLPATVRNRASPVCQERMQRNRERDDQFVAE